ncbi:MAG TPA: hypothetical protein VK369_10580, partial [Segetibacter sp.]|nr:hypothetical protein [Segetibacter sp.]
PEYVKTNSEKKQILAGKVTPLALADSLETDSKFVLDVLKQLRGGASKALACELDDIETWAHLSSYFAHKLRAGVALQTFRISKDVTQQQKAVAFLTRALEEWRKVAQITSGHYKEVPYIDDHSTGGSAYKDALLFSWSKYLPQVERDIILAKAAKTDRQ